MHFQTVNLFNSPRFIRRPLLFAEQTRIKRKPPKEESEDNKPGYLCWGQVGDLPTAEPVPTVSFNTVKHKEVSRKTDPVEIVNPDDPSQKVNALQTNKMTLDKTVPKEKNNTATKDADTELEIDGSSGLRKRSSGPATERYEVEYKPPERAL